MANYKVNLFYKLDTGGWSETYYTKASSSDQAWDLLKQGLGLRLQCLAEPAEMFAVRISDDAIYKDSSLFPLSPFTQFSSAWRADLPFMASQIRIQSGDLYNRSLMLRGIPDCAVTQDLPDLPGNLLFQQAQNAFVNYLKRPNGPFYIKARSKDPAVSPRLNIPFFLLNVDLTWTVTTAVAHNLLAGDRVQFYNVRSKPPFGTQIVQSVGSSVTFTVKGSGIPAFSYELGGWCRKVIYDYFQVDYATFRKFTHRDTGRPFGQSRGRRPSRAR